MAQAKKPTVQNFFHVQHILGTYPLFCKLRINVDKMTRFIQKKIESDFAQKAQNILKPDRAARPHPLVHILSSVCVIKYTQIWRALSGFTFLKQNDFYCLLTSGNRNFQSLECIRSLIRSKPHYCPKRKFNKSNTSKPG